MKLDSQNASSPVKFLIGKFVSDLIISQILLRMPNFEQQAVKGWGHRCEELLL